MTGRLRLNFSPRILEGRLNVIQTGAIRGRGFQCNRAAEIISTTLTSNAGERGESAKLPHRKGTVLCDRRDIIEEKREVQVDAAIAFGLSYLVEVLQEQ